VTVHYERRGSGPALVLLHGIAHRWQAWEPVIDRLAEHHDVIALDLPGFGHSPVPDGGMPHDMAGIVTAVAKILSDLGIDRPHVAGNSLGGGIALELAVARQAATATALSPVGFYNRREGRRGMAILSVMRANSFLPASVLRGALGSPAVRARSLRYVVEHPSRLSAEQVLADTLAMRRGKGFVGTARALRGYTFAGTIDVPVTIAWGTRDRLLPYGEAARARKVLPDARHVDLPGCGHVPMSDDPDLVARVILDTTATV
jgi:pimeloyl-ACP methyl ester carboxylesterase